MDYAEHPLVMIRLADDLVVHVDCAEHRLAMIDLHIESIFSKLLFLFVTRYTRSTVSIIFELFKL